MPDTLKALDASGRPIHPMLPINGRLPPINFRLMEDGQVQLDIFVRCGSNTGKYFAKQLAPAQAFEFLEDYRNAWQYTGTEAAIQLLETFFQWEWTGGTPTLDGQKSSTSNLTLEDLGL